MLPSHPPASSGSPPILRSLSRRLSSEAVEKTRSSAPAVRRGRPSPGRFQKRFQPDQPPRVLGPVVHLAGDRVPHEISGTLEVAVANAARDAEASGLADPVVLLSPACASFDQYRNFEIRGAAFRDLVTALPGVKPVV